MKNYLAQTLAGVRVLLVLTVLLGVIYPLGIWAIGRVPGLQDNAEGSLLSKDGTVVGSSLIGLDPVPTDPAHDPWFHNRPSAGSNDPLGPGDPSKSGGSNKSSDNPDLVAAIGQRRDAIAAREQVPVDQVPPDAVTASGSGLDPAISPAYAELQAPRVAREAGLPADRVRALIAANTSSPGAGVSGVRVLPLNLAVQAAAGH